MSSVVSTKIKPLKLQNLFPKREITTSDVFFRIQGRRKPLYLHSEVVGAASGLLDSLFQAKRNCVSVNGAFSYTVTWNSGPSKADAYYRSALSKMLQLCYGGTQSFSSDECCAALAAAIQLQLKCQKFIEERIKSYMIEVATKNVVIGVKVLLQSALTYDECHCDYTNRIDLDLAKVVLKQNNITRYYDLVVDGCLMKLPSYYLDLAEYGEAHSRESEFRVREKYVKRYHSVISKTEQKRIILLCSLETLGFDELTAMQRLDVLTPDELNSFFIRVVKSKDNLLRSVVMERDKLSKKVIATANERDRIRKERDRIAKERNKACSQRDRMKNELEQANDQMEKMEGELDKALAGKKEAERLFSVFRNYYEYYQDAHKKSETKLADASRERDRLRTSYHNTLQKLADATQERDRLRRERNEYLLNGQREARMWRERYNELVSRTLSDTSDHSEARTNTQSSHSQSYSDRPHDNSYGPSEHQRGSQNSFLISSIQSVASGVATVVSFIVNRCSILFREIM